MNSTGSDPAIKMYFLCIFNKMIMVMLVSRDDEVVQRVNCGLARAISGLFFGAPPINCSI